MAIQLPAATTARLDRKELPSQRYPYIFLGVLLLPFARKIRHAAKVLGGTMSILLVLAAGIACMTGLSGCGSGGGTTTQQGATYTMVETVTSGALSHSTTITLTVE
jgi:hypothetical protein